MDCLARLRQLMKQQHMSEYKMAKASGVPLSTINSLFHKGNCPTLPTLEGLCQGLNITLYDFFYEPGSDENIDAETRCLLDKWYMLNEREKSVILEFINMLIKD